MPVFLGTYNNDTLIGSVGADIIFGRNGADRIVGAEGSDTLNGEAGNDRLFGGRGGDELDGGDGADTLTPGANLDYDIILASFGSDTVDFTGADESSDYEIYYGGFGSGFFDRIEATIGETSGTVGKFVFDGVDDVLDSTDRLINMNLIDSADGYLFIGGTDGDDRFVVSRASGPALWFRGGEGADTVVGDARTFEVLTVDAPQIDPSDLDFYDSRIGVTVSVASSTAAGQMTGTAGSPFAPGQGVSFSDVDLIIGTGLNDFFTGAGGADSFRPGLGDDGMDGGAGFDTVRYDNSTLVETYVDLAVGEAVKIFFTFSGRRFNEDGLRSVEGVVGGERSKDELRGSAAANRLDGQGEDDVLLGRAGDDTLIGGDGNDTLSGGAGRDVFVFDGDDGEDRIRGFENGFDRIQIVNGPTQFSDLSIAPAGLGAIVAFGETTIRLTALNPSLLDASDFLFG